MTTRGYETATPPTGNVTATKGNTIVRRSRTDHEKTYVETSGIKMPIPPKVPAVEAFRPLDHPVQP